MPSRASSLLTRRLTLDFGRLSRRAAAEKPFCSTTDAKNRISLRFCIALIVSGQDLLRQLLFHKWNSVLLFRRLLKGRSRRLDHGQQRPDNGSLSRRRTAMSFMSKLIVTALVAPLSFASSGFA